MTLLIILPYRSYSVYAATLLGMLIKPLDVLTCSTSPDLSFSQQKPFTNCLPPLEDTPHCTGSFNS